jgi:Raf kinase inhibitor-like YbhB/YbcL family protein
MSNGSQVQAPWILYSSAFQENGQIPKDYTCDGRNISPPLDWSLVPAQAQSLVLIVEGPDEENESLVHWVVYNIPPNATDFASPALPEGAYNPLAPSQQSLFGGRAEQGVNSWGETGYRGPCPPDGLHYYFFKLYALDIVLRFDALVRPSEAQIWEQVEQRAARIVGEAELVGTYQRE